MKRERLISVLLGTLIAAAMGFGGVMCIATGFVLDWDANTVLIFCVLWALAAAFAAQFRFGTGLLAAAGAAAGWFGFRQPLAEAMEGLLYRITDIYHRAYGFPVVSWSETPPLEAGPEPALCLLAALVILGVCRTVCRRRSALWGLLPGVLCLASCMVVTDTVPENAAIFLVITAALLLLLPQTVRRRTAAEGNRLTAMLLIPCCLMTLLLFWAVPREGYENRDNTLQQAVLDWIWDLPFMPDRPDGSGAVSVPSPVPGLSTPLSTLGPREESTTPVLRVTAPQTEILYLRGQAYEVYDGLKWIAPDEDLTDDGWPSMQSYYVGPLQINTVGFQPVQYFPYYIDKSQLQTLMDRGALTNDGLTLSYSFQMMEAQGGAFLSSQLRERCLSLPEAAGEELKTLLADRVLSESLDRLSPQQIASQIAQYVSGIASYDLNTQQMPSGEEDFALWFLTQGETGYCVHYATAATVLLRAAGIPARYVTGYAVTAYENTPVTVLAKDAHAWVEYFLEGTGWVKLDATPAEGRPEAPEEMPPIVTDPAEPSTEPEGTAGPTQNTTLPDRPTVTTPTQGTTESPEPQGLRAQWLVPVLQGLGIAGLSVLLAWGQYLLRRNLRRRWLRRQPPNARALAQWRLARRLCRLLKEEPPEELADLAEKAVFSQHTLSAGELRCFDRWCRQAEQRLGEKPFYWLKKLIWALE